MGFAHEGVWVMGYCGPMGYGVRFPAHQVGGWPGLWVKRGYGLPEVWVKRGSTVGVLDWCRYRKDNGNIRGTIEIHAQNLGIQTGNVTCLPGNITSGLPEHNVCLWYILDSSCCLPQPWELHLFQSSTWSVPHGPSLILQVAFILSLSPLTFRDLLCFTV